MTGLRFGLAGIGMLGLYGFLLLATGTGGETAAPPVVNDQQFHARLLKIAEIYPIYRRVDADFRWGIADCRASIPAQPRFSHSSDEATHGRKLYSLFSRGRDAYLATPKANPVGQIIVKESWIPQEVEAEPRVESSRKAETPKTKVPPVPEDLAPLNARGREGIADHFHPFAEKKGKWYKASERGPLFVMMKLDPKTAGTDEGWVYGTVTADGKTVTSGGRVASCMKCHESKKDRLFGLYRQEEKKDGKP